VRCGAGWSIDAPSRIARSLMTAVAADGCRGGPEHGPMTQPARDVHCRAQHPSGSWLRTRSAAGLGATFPSGVSLGRSKRTKKMGRLQRADSRNVQDHRSRVYISDGAHYDNLALMTLLRPDVRDLDPRRIPSRADSRRIPSHRGARAREIGAVIDVTSRHSWPGSEGLPSDRPLGTITYADGLTCRLVVLKLGLLRVTAGASRSTR